VSRGDALLKQHKESTTDEEMKSVLSRNGNWFPEKTHFRLQPGADIMKQFGSYFTDENLCQE
jgi:hypothetical protein